MNCLLWWRLMQIEQILQIGAKVLVWFNCLPLVLVLIYDIEVWSILMLRTFVLQTLVECGMIWQMKRMMMMRKMKD